MAFILVLFHLYKPQSTNLVITSHVPDRRSSPGLLTGPPNFLQKVFNLCELVPWQKLVPFI
jgi:hypothetical protein